MEKPFGFHLSTLSKQTTQSQCPRKDSTLVVSLKAYYWKITLLREVIAKTPKNHDTINCSFLKSKNAQLDSKHSPQTAFYTNGVKFSIKIYSRR